MAAARFPWYWREDVHRVWEILRLRGLTYFLVVRGALRWGWIHVHVHDAHDSAWSFSTRSLPDCAAPDGFHLCGRRRHSGAVTWCFNEWLYRRHESSAP